jgi:hypothetical protein
MTVERFMKLSNNVNKRECLDALKKSGVPDILKAKSHSSLVANSNAYSWREQL